MLDPHLPLCVINTYNKIIVHLPVCKRLVVGAQVTAHGMLDSSALDIMIDALAQAGCTANTRLLLYRFATCRLIAKLMLLVFTNEHALRGPASAHAAYTKCDTIACRAGDHIQGSMLEHAMGSFNAGSSSHQCAVRLLDRLHDMCIERDFYLNFGAK